MKIRPTSFPDGSVSNPDMPWAASAGAGVLEPGRLVEDRPITEQEDIYSHTEQAPDGVRKWVALRGRAQDSTRAELVALLLALAAPGPMHIGQDNDAAVRLMQAILRGTSTIRERPLRLLPNGDLISAIRQVIWAKGTGSLGATKLKGHTSGDGTEAPWAFPEDRAHNQIADETAARGRESAPLEARTYLSTFVGRSKAYTLLVRRIQEIAVASLKASIDIYKSLVAGGDLTLVGRPAMRMLRVIRPPPGPDGDDIWSYAEPGLSQPSPGASFPDEKSRRLFDFWKGMTFGPCESGRGTSWLELLILFDTQCEGPEADGSIASPLRRRDSAKEALATFKTSSRMIVDIFLGSSSGHDIIGPDRKRGIRLSSLGVANSVACINARARMSTNDCRRTAAEVIRLAGSSRGVALKFARGEPLSRRVTSLRLGGSPPWRVSPLGPQECQVDLPGTEESLLDEERFDVRDDDDDEDLQGPANADSPVQSEAQCTASSSHRPIRSRSAVAPEGTDLRLTWNYHGTCPKCQRLRVIQTLHAIIFKRPDMPRYGCVGCNLFFDWGRFRCLFCSKPFSHCRCPRGPGSAPPEGQPTQEGEPHPPDPHSQPTGGPFPANAPLAGHGLSSQHSVWSDRPGRPGRLPAVHVGSASDPPGQLAWLAGARPSDALAEEVV